MKTFKEYVAEAESDVTLKTLKGELPGPYSVTPTRPKTWYTGFRVDTGNPAEFKYEKRWWSPKGFENANFVTVKTSENRGIAAQVMRRMIGMYANYPNSNAVRDMKKAGGIMLFTLAGKPIGKAQEEAGWYSFKPAGFTIAFDPTINIEQAAQSVWTLLNKEIEHETKVADKAVKWKAGAADRKKEASKAYAVRWKEQRQKLYDKYGKKNVDSVTSRQIGGDDGYQHYILINGQIASSNMTASEVPYAKLNAYARLLQKNGKR